MRSLGLRCFAVATVILSVITGCTSVGQPAGTSSAAAVTASSAAGPASPSTEASPSAKPSPSATPIPSLASTTELAAKAPAGATSIDMTPDADKPRFKPDAVTVKAGTATFFLTSVALTGTFGPFHDMIIGPEIGTPLASSRSVQPGTSAVFTVEGLAPGTYQFWCNTNTGHGLHYKLGMVGTLTVTP